MEKKTMDELNRISANEFKEMEKHPFCLILDNIRSMNNVGSVFRTADAFVASHVYLCGITATPPHRDIEKTALGATESVNWSYHKQTAEVVKQLQLTGWKVYAVEQAKSSQMLHHFEPSPTSRYAFILGNEVFGVEEEVLELVDGILEIPQGGTKHSLNISVTTGIICWDFVSKIQAFSNSL